MTTYVSESEVAQKTDSPWKRQARAFGLYLAYFGVMASLLMLSVIMLAATTVIDVAAEGFTTIVILNAISVGVIVLGVALRHFNK